MRCLILPGGQILALNRISLEGFTFDMAVRMIQNSPDNIELIISQSKGMSSSAFRSWRVFFILRSASLPSGTGILSHGGLVHYFPRGNGFGTNQ